jgi:hypothetical protein
MMSRLRLKSKSLVIKRRNDQSINGLLLRRSPRFFLAKKDMKGRERMLSIPLIL